MDDEKQKKVEVLREAIRILEAKLNTVEEYYSPPTVAEILDVAELERIYAIPS